VQQERTERTALVLGAGASLAYGFPLGQHLKQQILSAVEGHLRGRVEYDGRGGQSRVVDDLYGFPAELLQEFHEVFKYSAHPTIDQFLERKTKFRDLGAHLIAHVLLPLEQSNKLFPHSGWYAYLFECLGFEQDEPDISCLSIVTLNYERSLEHFLRKNIDYNCRQDREGFAHAKRSKLRIVHAHGSLGDYPSAPYGSTVTADSIRAAAKRIRIMSDNMEDSDDFKKAQELVAECDRAIFLGFGYHAQVLKGLFAKANISKMLFGGSGYGLSSSDQKNASDALGQHISFAQSGMDANSFIRSIALIRRFPVGTIVSHAWM
jgi:hypothetical protein